uniref:lipopolysaccharide-induced tumor necrosis factor-alpha factor homolog n=1 Tax=Semicossyphus pulcher TaxID=241346 RepID=UPI0037E99F06
MTFNGETKRIVKELKQLSLKRHQLQERKKIQCLFEELRNRAEFGQTEEASSSQKEIYSIDAQLQQLTEKKAKLQQSLANSSNAEDEKNHEKEVSFPSSSKPAPPPSSNVLYVEAPPTFPAPTVHLDLNNLPMCPCRTQCPECRQFVETETFTSVNSGTWMMCFMIAMMGCVAGCCLIPFCTKNFKSTTHRCPLCRTSIQTIKKV